MEGPQAQEPAFWRSGILAFAFWHSSVLHLWRDSRILASRGKRIPVNEPYTPKTYVDSVPKQAGGSGAAVSASGTLHSVRHVSAPLHLTGALPLVEASAERGGWGYVLVAAPCIPTSGPCPIYGCCTEQFSGTQGVAPPSPRSTGYGACGERGENFGYAMAWQVASAAPRSRRLDYQGDGRRWTKGR